MAVKELITLKTGSNVLTNPDGSPDYEVIDELIRQLIELKARGYRVIWISSGAVAVGRSLFKSSRSMDETTQRQVYSSIGQAHLIGLYQKKFSRHDLTCSQVLVTKKDFDYHQHYRNMKNCITALLDAGVIPVVNENDTVSISELMFTDNDELATLVATMMGSHRLVYLTNVDGIYTENPSLSTAIHIPVLGADQNLEDIQTSASSSFGRGGALSKIRLAQRAAQLGVTTLITNGKRPGSVLDSLAGKGLYTRVEAKKVLKPAKRKLAWARDHIGAFVTINDGAEKALLQEKACSLLAVGLITFDPFAKDDILGIRNTREQVIGIGRANIDATELQQGTRKPVVHYDFLYLFPGE